MGFLKRNAPLKQAGSALTIIAEGNKFSGEMNVVGSMHIDGIFEGSINSLDLISIGRTGQVFGKIRARQLSVCGTLEGEIECEELQVESGGDVRGIVVSTVLSVDPKGCFVGERRLLEKASKNRLPQDRDGQAEKSSSLNPAIANLPDKVVLAKDVEEV